MTELEKLDAGLPFDVNDPEVDARKLHAALGCKKLDEIDVRVLRRVHADDVCATATVEVDTGDVIEDVLPPVFE